MAHLLEAYDDLNSIVVALYDAMYVEAIRQKERTMYYSCMKVS